MPVWNDTVYSRNIESVMKGDFDSGTELKSLISLPTGQRENY